MNVYLMRHAEAEPVSETIEDKSRTLTDKGIKTVESELPSIRKLVGQVDYILTSPFQRAFRTALLLGEYFRAENFIQVVEELAVRGEEKAISVILNKVIGKENVFVVGHMPHLSELAKYFTGDPGEDDIKIQKAGVLKITFSGFPDMGQGKIRWSMSPEELLKI
ncbi:MAG TPA: phosphohistidine phosphatase SixA [bacterium]|nr:phosphohistidine phosphatase SixA [bacterium]